MKLVYFVVIKTLVTFEYKYIIQINGSCKLYFHFDEDVCVDLKISFKKMTAFPDVSALKFNNQ